MKLICCECKEEKECSSFSKKSNSKRGYSSKCKECHNRYVREKWYPLNSEKQKQSSANWKEKNKERVLAARYGVDIKEVTKALIVAGNRCQICGSTNSLHLDHCHSTNKIRGVLCRECNTLLGRLGDNKESVLQKCNSFLKYLSLDKENKD